MAQQRRGQSPNGDKPKSDPVYVVAFDEGPIQRIIDENVPAKNQDEAMRAVLAKRPEEEQTKKVSAWLKRGFVREQYEPETTVELKPKKKAATG